jgi:hypothetical protein
MMNSTTTDRETAMKTGHWMRTLASVGLGLCWMAMPAASHAADNFTAVTAADKPAKAKKPKQSKAPKAPGNTGTGESSRARQATVARMPWQSQCRRL